MCHWFHHHGSASNFVNLNLLRSSKTRRDPSKLESFTHIPANGGVSYVQFRTRSGDEVQIPVPCLWAWVATALGTGSAPAQFNMLGFIEHAVLGFNGLTLMCTWVKEIQRTQVIAGWTSCGSLSCTVPAAARVRLSTVAASGRCCFRCHNPPTHAAAVFAPASAACAVAVPT